MSDVQTRDVFSLLIIVGCFVCIILGIKVEIFVSLLTTMFGYLFGAHSNKGRR